MPPSWTQTVDSFFTSTWAYRKDPAVIQSFLKNPFILLMKEKGNVLEVPGYRRLEIPLEYARNESIRWIGRGGTVPLTETETLTMAYEDWKYLAVNIVRYGVDDHQNKGKARLINYAEHKIKNAEAAVWDQFETVLCGDGTGTNEPNGLGNLIENTAVASQTATVHGLSRSTYSWWRNQRKAASGSYSVYLTSDMTNIMNTCLKYSGTSSSDLTILTDQTSYEYYDEEVAEQKQIVNKTLGDAGFEYLQYRGRPLIWSPSATANQMRFVNLNYLKLMYDPGLFMDMTEWKPIPNQPNDRVAQIVCAMNFVCSRPIANGLLTTTA